VQLVSKISNLCDHNPPTSQTDGQTDGRHAIPRPRICTKVHCAVKTLSSYVSVIKVWRSVHAGSCPCICNTCVNHESRILFAEIDSGGLAASATVVGGGDLIRDIDRRRAIYATASVITSSTDGVIEQPTECATELPHYVTNDVIIVTPALTLQRRRPIRNMTGVIIGRLAFI